jgi:haloalkane dehalogenase
MMTGFRRSRVARVLHSHLHYLETGHGRPVLLLHGNPTSSFLWRHVLERAGDSPGHRWIAPDLIGMGGSGKPDIDYRLADHIEFVEAFVDGLGLAELVLVAHDWGVAIALDLLRRRPELVRGVAFMETHLRAVPSWEAFDSGGRTLFGQLRTPGVGEQLALEDNVFIDTLLPAALTNATNVELSAYAEPYPTPASRRPLLQWAREIPIGGEPADVAARFAANLENLVDSDVPKLLLHADPGMLVGPDLVAWCRANLSSITVVDVGGPAGHFLPEDRPAEVADALIEWVQSLDP